MTTSSSTAFCAAARTSTGTVHHWSVRLAAATVVFTPSALAAAYSARPGMPTAAASTTPAQQVLPRPPQVGADGVARRRRLLRR